MLFAAACAALRLGSSRVRIHCYFFVRFCPFASDSETIHHASTPRRNGCVEGGIVGAGRHDAEPCGGAPIEATPSISNALRAPRSQGKKWDRGVRRVPGYTKNAQLRGERILGRGRCVERESCRFSRTVDSAPETGAAYHGSQRRDTRETDIA